MRSVIERHHSAATLLQPRTLLEGGRDQVCPWFNTVVGCARFRGIVQRRDPARQTAAGTRPAHSRPIAASGNGAPVAVPGVHVGAGCDERSDDSAIAVFRRIVQRGEAIAPVHGGAGVRGWAPRSTQLVPENKTVRRPRGSTAASFWENVNGTEYSERTRSTRDLAPRSRIHQTYQTSESRGNGDCGRRRRREIVRLGNMAGERTRHGPWRRDRHGGAPACNIKIA